MQVLQEEVIWKLEVVAVSSVPAPSPAVWVSPPHSLLHKHDHHHCLLSVDMAAQAVVEVGGTFDVLAWRVVDVGVGDPSAGFQWGCLFGHWHTLGLLQRVESWHDCIQERV